MVRTRIIQTIKYGKFREALEELTELNRLCVQKGLPAATFWSPLSGPNNEIIIESECESLAELERQNAAFYSDRDIMKVWRGVAEYIIEGTGRSEVLETAPTLV